MNIDSLTIGEVKQIQTFLGGTQSAPKVDLYSRYIGKYVIVRSRNEGINAGVVVAADETGIILKDARRLWYHKPVNKSESWYEGVANYGISSDSKISGPVSEKAIIENFSVTLCTSTAEASIREADSHGQN